MYYNYDIKETHNRNNFLSNLFSVWWQTNGIYMYITSGKCANDYYNLATHSNIIYFPIYTYNHSIKIVIITWNDCWMVLFTQTYDAQYLPKLMIWPTPCQKIHILSSIFNVYNIAYPVPETLIFPILCPTGTLSDAYICAFDPHVHQHFFNHNIKIKIKKK